MAHSLAPDYEFIAYIDESGDPSLKRVRPIDPTGSTEWLVISAVLVRRQFDDDATKWVSNIAKTVGSPVPHIIHFKDLSPEAKMAACHEVAELPLRLFVVASNKKNMRGYRNEKAEKIGAKQWFYNWISRILIERVTDYCFRYALRKGLTRKHVKFVFSQTGGHSYSQTAAYHELLKYQSRGNRMVLNKWTPRWEVMNWNLVENFPHSKRAGLQLADIAASAFYQAVDNLDTGPCNTSYAKALLNRVAMNQDEERRDYGLVLQPTPAWKGELSEEQKEIFRFYGYDFPNGR